MTPDLTPLNLSLLHDQQTLNTALLSAARLHVGEAGLEQMRALEHLIVAGQQHGRLIQAVRRLLHIVQQSQDSTTEQPLLQDTLALLLMLDQLALVVTEALQQITATPVQYISAERLEEISTQMKHRLTDLELLILTAEQHPDIPDSSTPELEEILSELQTQVRRIADEERRSHLEILVRLATQATTDLSMLTQISAAERAAAVQAIQTVSQRCLEALTAEPKTRS